MPEFGNPVGLSPPLGLYSHFAIHAQSRLVFLAGQLSVDETGRLVGDSKISQQLDQVMKNIGVALDAAGLTHRNVLQMTTYLRDRPNAVEEFYSAREATFPKYFGTEDPYPPNTLLIVSSLVRPHFLVEVQAVAGP